MKGLLLSGALALGMGAFALAPANAAPIATHGVIVAPAAVTDVACRTVTKTVYRNGVRKTVTTQDCSRPRVYERRVYRNGPGWRPHHDRPGITVRVR